MPSTVPYKALVEIGAIRSQLNEARLDLQRSRRGWAD
jgi:hypothetical protein